MRIYIYIIYDFKLHSLSSYKILSQSSTALQQCITGQRKLPLEFVSFVLQLFHFVVPEEISNVCNKISVDTVHVTRRGYNSIHIFVTIMNTFFYLGKIEI